MYNLCKRFDLVLRSTMNLSEARARITKEDFMEWVGKMEIILAQPRVAAVLPHPHRIFNTVKQSSCCILAFY